MFESMKDVIVELILITASVGGSGSDSQEVQNIMANWEFTTAVKMMSVLTEEVMKYFAIHSRL